MNRNISNIKLGDPGMVKIKDCPNLQTLDLQITQRLEQLSLKGEIGGGAIKRAIEILAQRNDEESIAESDGLGDIRIGYSDPQAMIDGNRVQLLAMYGNYGSSTDYRWELMEVVSQSEGANPTITDDGVFTVNAGCGSVVKVKLHNSTNEDECLVGYVGLSILAEYPQLVPIVSEYTDLAQQIIENLSLRPLLVEYPAIVNSLVDTGKMNYLVCDGVAYIDTAIKPLRTHKYHIIFNARSNDNCFIMGTNNYSPLCTNGGLRPTNENVIYRGDLTGRREVIFDTSTIIVDGVTKVYERDTGNTIGASLWLFRRIGNNASANNKVNLFEIIDSENYKLVPFQRSNGECGMLDLISLQFYGNANTTGQFTIVTEDK